MLSILRANAHASLRITESKPSSSFAMSSLKRPCRYISTEQHVSSSMRVITRSPPFVRSFIHSFIHPRDRNIWINDCARAGRRAPVSHRSQPRLRTLPGGGGSGAGSAQLSLSEIDSCEPGGRHRQTGRRRAARIKPRRASRRPIIVGKSEEEVASHVRPSVRLSLARSVAQSQSRRLNVTSSDYNRPQCNDFLTARKSTQLRWFHAATETHTGTAFDRVEKRIDIENRPEISSCFDEAGCN